MDEQPFQLLKEVRSPLDAQKIMRVRSIMNMSLLVSRTSSCSAEYELVMGTTPSQFSATGEGKETAANLATGNSPVEAESFNESVEFCARLSQHEQLGPFNVLSSQTVTTLEGTGYRLPTEAECSMKRFPKMKSPRKVIE